MCVRVLFSESYLIQRLEHFTEELACTCDGSFSRGVEGTTSSRGGGCLLSGVWGVFYPPSPPFQYIFFLLPKKETPEGNKNKTAPIKEEGDRSGGGQSGSVTTQIQLLPCGSWRGEVGRREPHTRPPPRPCPAAAPGPGGPAEPRPPRETSCRIMGGGGN